MGGRVHWAFEPVRSGVCPTEKRGKTVVDVRFMLGGIENNPSVKHMIIHSAW
jgi:hypothetical protein